MLGFFSNVDMYCFPSVCLCEGAIGLGGGLFSGDADFPSAGKSGVMCVGNETRLSNCSSVQVDGESARCETSSAVCQGWYNFM